MNEEMIAEIEAFNMRVDGQRAGRPPWNWASLPGLMVPPQNDPRYNIGYQHGSETLWWPWLRSFRDTHAQVRVRILRRYQAMRQT